jgi:hypothetical protein
MRWWWWLNTLSWIFLALAHWNWNQRVDMSLQLETLSRLRANQSLFLLFNAANQSLFLLFNAACLVEMQIPILYSLTWPEWAEQPRYNYNKIIAYHWCSKKFQVLLIFRNILFDIIFSHFCMFWWYFENPLPMVDQTSYPWYIEPLIHGISNPIPMIFWPPTHGMLTPYPLYFEPSTHGILNPLPMVYWTPSW